MIIALSGQMGGSSRMDAIIFNGKEYTQDEFCSKICEDRFDSECFTTCPYTDYDEE